MLLAQSLQARHLGAHFFRIAVWVAADDGQADVHGPAHAQDRHGFDQGIDAFERLDPPNKEQHLLAGRDADELFGLIG